MRNVSAFILSLILMIPAAAGAGPVETVVVTATRTAQPQARTGDSISVITADDLAAGQTVAVTDALARTPGLVVVRNGGPGQTTTIGLRGAEAGQTLVLVDGVRINDPSTVDGEAVLGDLLVNNIARIEVLRGPQSTLYGSDAIGGVVNILTKRGGPHPFAFTGSFGGGSFGTYRFNAAANGAAGGFEYGAALNYLHTNGISAADARNANPDNFGATANTHYRLSDALSVDLRAYYTNARTEFDDNYRPPDFRIADSPVYERNALFAGYAGVNLALFGGHLRNRIAYLGSLSRRTVYDSPFYLPLHEDYGFRGEAQRFEYQGIVDLDADVQVSFGVEIERTALDSETAGTPGATGRKRVTGVYLQGQTTLFSELTLTAGLRHDDDEAFGGHTSLKAAVAWSPDGDRTILRANYGDGFKAPTLYELYSEYSNPLARLAPETAHGWEAGIDRSLFAGRMRASLTYFERRTKNLIDFFSCFGAVSPACALRSAVGGYYYNVGRTRARGIELSLDGDITRTLHAAMRVTDMHAIDEATHTDLARRPHLLASGRIRWTPTDGWSFAAAVLYVGRRNDGAGGVSPLASHTTADLLASHRLNAHFELFARVENLFDARYEPLAGYGAPGRAVYAGIRVRD